MATPTPAEIKARYPEFASLTDPQVQLAIDDAAPFFDVDRWGDFYSQGVAAFVAHALACSKATAGGSASGIPGVRQSKRVGEVQVSYATAQYSAKDAGFSATDYGRKYLELRRLVGMGAVSV